jgi:ligand-binding sensor domain-containing protein
MIDPATGKTQTWEDHRQMGGTQALAVTADPAGRIWFGGSHRGLAMFDPRTSRLKRFAEQDGLPLDRVRRILVDAENTLWVMGAPGVYRSSSVLRDPIRFTRQNIPGEASGQIYSNGAFDEDGCVWITSTNGLYRYHGGQWDRYDEKDGLKSASVSPIAISNGTVWIAYRSPLGLTRISQPHGHWSVTTFDTHSGLPSDMMYALDARSGTVWATTR